MKPAKSTAARPIYLKDYRPPSYLIDEVDLDVALDPTRTRVRARLSVRPNAAGRKEPLRLDGRQLELQSISVDGRTLGTKDYKLTDTSLTLVKTPTKPFKLEIVTILNPEANKALQG